MNTGLGPAPLRPMRPLDSGMEVPFTGHVLLQMNVFPFQSSDTGDTTAFLSHRPGKHDRKPLPGSAAAGFGQMSLFSLLLKTPAPSMLFHHGTRRQGGRRH